MKKKLVYVAHPYGGKESNRKKIDVIMGDLVLNDTSHDYISPIHNFGYVYLTGDDYQRGLDICLSLLGQCDILVLCPEWESSRGCKGEFEYANCLKSVFPKIKGNEVLNIARELGFIDWSKVKVDTPILVSQNKVDWKPRYFARYTRGVVETWLCGCTSWSIDSANDTCIWKYAKLVGDDDE